jgi:hypothetical protein
MVKGNPSLAEQQQRLNESIREYLDQGLSLIPLHRDSKISYVPKGNPLLDQHVLKVGEIVEGDKGWLRAIYDPDNPLNAPLFENPKNHGAEEVQRGDGTTWTKKNYFEKDDHGTFYGVAISLKPSGLSALDVDGPEARNALQEKLKELDTVLPKEAATVISGRKDGGSHHYFRVPQGIDWSTTNDTVDLWGVEGLEYKVRGYMVAPPTIHPKTMKRYRFEGRGFGDA